MKTLLKGGTVVSPEGERRADVLIVDGVIAAVGEELPGCEAQTLDVSGMLLFPGFIDTHTHFDLNNGVTVTADGFYTGTRAAIAGGTTTILDFATQNKGEALGQALDNWHELARGKSSCDYGFHMAITDWNGGVAGQMREMSAQGVTSYKVYMAYDALRVSDAEIFEILEAAGKEGALVGCHCENGDLIKELTRRELTRGNTGPAAHPAAHAPILEAEAVCRYLAIAMEAGVGVNIVHLSTRAGLEIIRGFRQKGVKAYIETCPQYLALDDGAYLKPGFEGAKYVMSPPLRKRADVDALWEGVASGDVDTVGTDHCSFNFAGQKELGLGDFSKIPNGAPGVQDRGELIYTLGVCAGRISASRMCALLSENPAKLFGMYPKKGVIAPGADADIVVWEGGCSSVISSSNRLYANDYTQYEGMKINGRAKDVFLRGSRVVQNGRVAMENMGEYVARGPSMLYR